MPFESPGEVTDTLKAKLKHHNLKGFRLTTLAVCFKKSTIRSATNLTKAGIYFFAPTIVHLNSPAMRFLFDNV